MTGLDALEAVIGALRPLPLIRLLEVRRPGRELPGASWSREPAFLRVKYAVPDAYAPGKPGHVQEFHMSIPDLGDYPTPCGPRGWAGWLLHALTYLAAHEVAEFFVVGGERLFDPHGRPGVQVVHLPPPPVHFLGRR